MSGLLNESGLDEVLAGWDCVRKLSAFAFDHSLVLILLLQYETLVQGTKYLALHFCCLSEIILRRKLESIWIF